MKTDISNDEFSDEQNCVVWVFLRKECENSRVVLVGRDGSPSARLDPGLMSMEDSKFFICELSPQSSFSSPRGLPHCPVTHYLPATFVQLIVPLLPL